MTNGPVRRSGPCGVPLWAALVTLLAPALPLPAAAAPQVWRVAGDADRGATLIARFGCSSCHTIPGLADAQGNVGPPLARIGTRSVIAGILPNNPANLVHWIREPQSVVPGNAMPDMGIGEADARDIAAYLYTLR